MNSLIILFLFLCYIFIIEANSNPLRILIIGDSLDRYMIHDWCVGTKGKFCRAYDDDDIHTNLNCYTNGTRLISLKDTFRSFTRSAAWSISICEHEIENVIVGFIFNTQGVASNSPWYIPSRSHVDIQGYDERKPKTIKDAMNHFLFPAFPNLIQAMSGPPHALSLNSCLWDIARLLYYAGEPTCQSNTLRADWIHSWTKNVSEWIDVLQEKLPSAEWIGWRDSPIYPNQNPPCRNPMMEDMQKSMNVLASSKHFHLESWLAKNPNTFVHMRDGIHPGIDPNIDHLQNLVHTIKHHFKDKRNAKTRRTIRP